MNKKNNGEYSELPEENGSHESSAGRRSFLKKAAIGGLSLAGMLKFPVSDQVSFATSSVSRASAPSDLKITDIRYALTGVLGGTAIIRIDTNQGIYGLGEVRDGADPRYALMIKSRILGLNPCNVEMIFKIINQFGGNGRQGGGVSGIEMALWDLCGKAYNVPVWQLLGGRYRDRIRLYADTPEGKSPEEQVKLIKYRTEEQGYTWLKMDLSIGELVNIPGTIVNQKYWLDNGELRQWQGGYMSYENTKHPRDWKSCAVLLRISGI